MLLRKNFVQGTQEEPERRDGMKVHQDDAANLKEVLLRKNFGEGFQEEIDCKNAQMTDVGKTREHIANLTAAGLGQGPQEVAERRDARITDAGKTRELIANLNVGEGPQEIEAHDIEHRRNAEKIHHDDAAEIEEYLLRKNFGQGPQDDGLRRDARITDVGKTREQIAKLNVGQGPQESADRGEKGYRKKASPRDEGAEEYLKAHADALGSGPQDDGLRRDARITDVGKTREQISKLKVGQGPVEEDERAAGARKGARITDTGASKASISQLAETNPSMKVRESVV